MLFSIARLSRMVSRGGLFSNISDISVMSNGTALRNPILNACSIDSGGLVAVRFDLGT